MKENFYDLCNIPFVSRESFNNTILLLTLVKSNSYYITRFNRLKSIIEIAFDMESELHSSVTESVTIDFESSCDNVLFNCELKNVLADKNAAFLTEKTNKKEWSIKNEKVVYELLVEKDDVFPLGVNDMNEIILKVKKNIYDFLEDYYFLVVTNGQNSI